MSEYVVVGGTGTLGRELTRQLLAQDPNAGITILSRDELKQQEMKREFWGYSHLRFALGDIRDKEGLLQAFRGAWVVFHVAALKHIDVVEANPVEGFKTNVLGTVNLAEAAMMTGADHVVFSSTDKAVMPINVYGNTKAIGERYVLSQNDSVYSNTRFSVFRWGNVIGSRGSVIHHFAKTLIEDRRIDITHPDMTRFWIRIEDAAKFMLGNYHKAPKDSALVPPMKAASVVRFAAVVAGLLGVKRYSINTIGMRPGEKIHEMIETGVSSDMAPQYTDDELAELIVPVLQKEAAA